MKRRNSVGPAITSGALLALLCACGDSPTDTSTGSIQIQTQTAAATAESSLDTDGYAVIVGELGNHSIESSGTLAFDQVPVGDHVVELQGLQDNCTTLSSPDTVTVVAGGTTQVSFEVTCWPPPTGRIAFTRTDDDGQHIYTMNADGTQPQRLTDDYQCNFWPVWSPDNRSIAFSGARTGFASDNLDIWVMNADGTGRTNITGHLATDQTPAWSPDGSKIAFSSDRDGNDEIYLMNADGSDVVRLTDGGSPAWSPDGSKIAFTDGSGGFTDVYVMNSDGTGKSNLSNHSGEDVTWAGSWSPDGERIVFSTDRHGNRDIYVMDSDGTNQVRLTTSNYNEIGGSWSPDGTKITYWGGCGFAGSCIYYMNADGTGIVNLTEDVGKDMYPSWSHNGG